MEKEQQERRAAGGEAVDAEWTPCREERRRDGQKEPGKVRFLTGSWRAQMDGKRHGTQAVPARWVGGSNVARGRAG